MRLPPPGPDDDCRRTTLRGTDRRLRVNVGGVVDTFEAGSSTHNRPQKRKRADNVIQWSHIESTVTLGVRPREFIVLLAAFCETINVKDTLQELASIGLPSTVTGTLVSLVTGHAVHSRSSSATRFWRSVIEIQVALRCERSVVSQDPSGV